MDNEISKGKNCWIMGFQFRSNFVWELDFNHLVDILENLEALLRSPKNIEMFYSVLLGR